MSIGFNWFKSYEIKKHPGDGAWCSDMYELIYLDGGNTSHSIGNIMPVQYFIFKYGKGKSIPYVNTETIDSEDYNLTGLIEPSEMSKICTSILESDEPGLDDFRDRIEWFKQLSDDGYYLTYDND